ncbi:MAG: hypothetical protein VCA74_04840 [Deltaproteobacteria bacterium]
MLRTLVAGLLVATVAVSAAGCMKGCKKEEAPVLPAATSEAPAEPTPQPDKPTT